MSISNDLATVIDLGLTAQQRVLQALITLGNKPTQPAEILLWEQQNMLLLNRINELSALNVKLTAQAVNEGLKELQANLTEIKTASENAKTKLAEITEVSDLLNTVAKILDMGVALVAAVASPSTTTLAAAYKAGKALIKATKKDTTEAEAETTEPETAAS